MFLTASHAWWLSQGDPEFRPESLSDMLMQAFNFSAMKALWDMYIVIALVRVLAVSIIHLTTAA